MRQGHPWDGGRMLATSTVVGAAMGTARDFDVGLDGSWVGLFWHADGSCYIHTSQSAAFPVATPLRHPKIRRVGIERIIVVDSRTDGASPNGYVFSTAGKVLAAFNAGDGIQDVVVLADLFAVTYFDEGVFSGRSPSDEGIAFFDFSGKFSWGYQSTLGGDGVDVADCYCACRTTDGNLVFSPYTDFPLIELNPR